MQITIKFITILVAVAYGSVPVFTLPISNSYNQYNTRELPFDLDGRDLSFLKTREFEDIQTRQVSQVPQMQHGSSHPGSSVSKAPTSSTRTEEEQVLHNLALADHTHPLRQQAIDAERSDNAYWNVAAAHPEHPDHAHAVERQREKHRQAQADRGHMFHKTDPQYKAAEHRQIMVALTDTMDSRHGLAKQQEAQDRENYRQKLENPHHPDHHEAKAQWHDHQADIHALASDADKRVAAEHDRAAEKHTKAADVSHKKSQMYAAMAAAARAKKHGHPHRRH